MKNGWKDWFTFTRKERTGIYVLVTLILAAACLPWFFTAGFPPPDKIISDYLRAEIRKAQWRSDSVDADDGKMRHYDLPAEKKSILFEFDPNTLSAEGWRKLGVRDRTIQTIQKYLSRGGKFRQPGDLQKVYGLREEVVKRLLPYVRIHFADTPVTYGKKERAPFVKSEKRLPAFVEINAADTTALIALPGIGGKLARRIITFRDKLGGFHSVEQVKETYGLSDSTFQVIQTMLQCSGITRKININAADGNTLMAHPYIGRNLANAIVRYREQHGNFERVEDLQKIVLVTPEIFQKIVYYLVVEQEGK